MAEATLTTPNTYRDNSRPASTAGAHPRKPSDPSINVRAADLEPYVGLRYLSKLFKLMGVILVLLLIAEIVTGFVTQGTDAVITLLGEASRLIVLAGLLWGSGDLAILLIDVGHDVRATRILMGRLSAHQVHEIDTNPKTPETNPPNTVVNTSVSGAPAVPLADVRR